MVMSLIESLTNIKNAVYGREVREAIHDGVFRANQIADGADAKSDNTRIRQDAVEDFNAQVIQEMTDKDVISAPEIIAARGGKPTLQARLAQTPILIQYSQLKSITRLNDALKIEGALVDIDEDITLNTPILLDKSGMWSSNGSTISLGDDGQIIASERFSIRNLKIINTSASSIKPMVLVSGGEETYFTGSLISNVKMDGSNRLRNGIEIISDHESRGVFGMKVEHLDINRMNDEIHIEVNHTNNNYGWVNGNSFYGIRGGDSYRGIVSLPIDKFARSRNVSNVFSDIQLQTYRTTALYDLGSNVYNIQPYDFHIPAHKGVISTKFGKINGEIHSLAQNTVTIFNPKHSEFLGSKYLEVGMFTDLSTPNSFLNIHFYTHKGVYKGKIILSLRNGHVTNNQYPVSIQYENVTLEDLSILTQYDQINDGIRVFIKSSGDIAYWGLYERKLFMPTYSPLTFSSEEIASMVTQAPLKEVGGFEASTIYESVIEGGQNITRYHDGRMIIFSDTVETRVIPPVPVDGTLGSTDLQVVFKRTFASKPIVTFSGHPSKEGNPITNIPISVRQTFTDYARGVFINKFVEPITVVNEFSWMAVGRWR